MFGDDFGWAGVKKAVHEFAAQHNCECLIVNCGCGGPCMYRDCLCTCMYDDSECICVMCVLCVCLSVCLSVCVYVCVRVCAMFQDCL